MGVFWLLMWSLIKCRCGNKCLSHRQLLRPLTSLRLRFLLLSRVINIIALISIWNCVILSTLQILVAYIDCFALINTIVRNFLTHSVYLINLDCVSVTLVLLLLFIVKWHHGAPLHLFILQNVLKMFVLLLILITRILLSNLSCNKTGIFIFIGDSNTDVLIIVLFNDFGGSLVESIVIVDTALFNASFTSSFEVRWRFVIWFWRLLFLIFLRVFVLVYELLSSTLLIIDVIQEVLIV